MRKHMEKNIKMWLLSIKCATAVIFALQFQFAISVDSGHAISKRRAPVFINRSGQEKETFLKAEDFSLAQHYPVPDQPLLPRRVLKSPASGFIEGDIYGFTPESFKEFVEQSNQMWKDIKSGRLLFSALRDPMKRWPNGIVPYALSSHYAQDARTKLAEAIAEYHSRTCLRFVPRTTQNDYVYIKSQGPYTCASLIGRQGGKQDLMLGAKCFQQGTIIHELMHAVGFFHEQSRPDRDDYVKIRWENIQSGTQQNFQKYSRGVIDVLNTPYDYRSVMHYGRTYFTRNGQPTIVPKQPGVRIGQRVGFSDLDVKRLNILYNCNVKPQPPGPGVRPVIPVIPITEPPLFTTPTPGPIHPPLPPIDFCTYCKACIGCRGCSGCEGCESCPSVWWPNRWDKQQERNK